MKTAISTFVTVILITLASIISATYITTHLQIVRARDYHTSVIDRIEASYFSNAVVLETKNEAVTKGYTLHMKDMTIYEDKKDMLVTMEYKVTMPIFGVIKEGIFEGYAR